MDSLIIWNPGHDWEIFENTDPLDCQSTACWCKNDVNNAGDSLLLSQHRQLILLLDWRNSLRLYRIFEIYWFLCPKTMGIYIKVSKRLKFSNAFIFEQYFNDSKKLILWHKIESGTYSGKYFWDDRNKPSSTSSVGKHLRVDFRSY